MDITYVDIGGLKMRYLINVIDDHSRFCLGSVPQFDQSPDTLIEVLPGVICEFGKPSKLLIDESPAFYSWSGEKTDQNIFLLDILFLF